MTTHPETHPGALVASTDADRIRCDVIDNGYEHIPTDENQLALAVREFEDALPGWWWSVTHCALTRDADCGPDARVLGMAHPHVQAFDDGFHEVFDGTLAGALRSVIAQAMEAIGDL